MKKSFLFLVLGFVFFLFQPHGNFASATYLYALENISIEKPLYGDVYILAGNGVVDEKIHGDLYIAGGTITINGDIEEDLVVGGGKVVVYGDVGGDLRILGGQVTVYGDVGEDIVVIAGQMDISKNTIVGGNLISGAGLLTIDGVIKGEMRGVIGVVFINGEIGKNVTLSVEDSIIISEGASIGGDLKYSAFLETNIPEGVVNGEVVFNKFQKERFLNDLTFLLFVQKVTSYVSMFLLLLTLVIFMPKGLINSAKKTKENLLKSFGVGVLTLISVFVGSIILMVTIVGIPFALMALSSMVAVFYFARIFASVWLAGYIVSFKGRVSRLKLFFASALTLFVYYLIGFIPYHIGRISTFIIFIIGIGSLVLLVIENLKFLKSKGQL